ncbi:hypothetical protein, partial [Salmonella enterica]|uniref:hypothetical protein n=1 Tax=Salmonella enterica TaxID=28901 RepID=UPI0035239A55
VVPGLWPKQTVMLRCCVTVFSKFQKSTPDDDHHRQSCNHCVLLCVANYGKWLVSFGFGFVSQT